MLQDSLRIRLCGNSTPKRWKCCLQLEKVAVAKWGSMPEVETERNSREQKKLKRAIENAGQAAPAVLLLVIHVMSLLNLGNLLLHNVSFFCVPKVYTV